MFQRIFGSSKKEKTSPTAAKPKPKVLARNPVSKQSSGSPTHVDPNSPSWTSPAATRGPATCSSTEAASARPPVTSPATPPETEMVKNFSMTIRSDPVPAGFKSQHGSGSGSPLSGGSHSIGSPKGHAGGSSFRSSTTHTDGSPASAFQAASLKPASGVSHPIPTAVAQRRSTSDLTFSRTAPAFTTSSPLLSRTSRSTLISNNSLAIPSAAGADGAGSSVNYWRLPWTQQKVVMCQYCNRPQKPRQPAAMNSKEVHSGASSAASNTDADAESSDSESDDDDDGDKHHPACLGSPMTTYCRCGQTADADGGTTAPTGAQESPAQPAPPPVFIVETDRSTNVIVPGTIADDGTSSDDEDRDAHGGRMHAMKLSLVSPLTSCSLMRNTGTTPGARSSSGVGSPHLGLGNSRASAPQEFSSPPPHPSGPTTGTGRSIGLASVGSRSVDPGTSANSVTSWVHEQQQHKQSEDPAAAAEAPES